MSINDIMKYVSKTPGNTNPSVIASMFKGEMNDTLKEAKEYTDNAFRELGIDKETKKTTYSGTLEVYGEVSTHIREGKFFGLVAGNTYTITLDSGTYTAVAKSYGNGGVYFGNDSAMGGEDTGETYCVGEILVAENYWQTGVTDLNCGTKYTITTETTTTTPIKPEYLPDLTGKAGTVKLEKTVVLPETTGTYIDGIQWNFPAISLNEGDKCVVVFNGATYHTECFTYDASSDGSGNMQIAIGNQSIKAETEEDLDKFNTGEPFMAVLLGDRLYTVLLESCDTLTIEIYQETETIHPIESKFLPGACLPVVEITSAPYPASGMVALSAQEVAQFVTAAEMQMPVVVKMELTPMQPGAIVCHCIMASEGNWGYLNGFGESSFWFLGDKESGMMGDPDAQ